MMMMMMMMTPFSAQPKIYLLHVVVIYAVVVVLTKVSRNSYYRRYWDVVTCSIYFITFNPFRPYKLKCPFILK